MPSSWAQIPKELLRVIFDQIEGGDYSATHTRKSCLFQLMLTCKHWSSIAREAFYNEQFTLDVEIANKLISDKTTPQLFIKNIAITCELASDASLIKLLSMCPDVTSLVVQGWPSEVEAPKTQKSFYTSLYVLSQSNHLAKLKRAEFTLQRTNTDQVLAHHQQAMLQLKDSLTHLEIMDYTINNRQHNAMEPPQRFVEWFDQLQEFPRLTTVRIDVNSLTYLYEMDGFIEKMGPTVTNIVIAMTNNNRVLQPLKSINPTTIARRSSTNTLELIVAIIRSEDLNYMMHKFDSLSELKITIIDYEANEASSLSEFRSDDSLRRFFEYLTRISKYLVTNILVHNSFLGQVLMDLKKCFQIKHLTLSNIDPTCEGISFSIKSLSKARNGHRRQVVLDLEIGTAQLLSVARLVYEVLNEDVVKLQFGNGLIDHYYDDYNERIPCHVQGEALQLGINLLPSLKSLTATNAEMNSVKSIINPKAPKLSLDLLELGECITPEAMFQLSQRIKHIDRWVMPYIHDCGERTVRLNCVLNMPFTTFGEIYIDSVCVSSNILKLSAGSNTTFHGVDSDSGDYQLLTEDDYCQQDDEYLSEDDDFEDFMDKIGRVHIICADVKRLTLGFATIKIED